MGSCHTEGRLNLPTCGMLIARNTLQAHGSTQLASHSGSIGSDAVPEPQVKDFDVSNTHHTAGRQCLYPCMDSGPDVIGSKRLMLRKRSYIPCSALRQGLARKLQQRRANSSTCEQMHKLT